MGCWNQGEQEREERISLLCYVCYAPKKYRLFWERLFAFFFFIAQAEFPYKKNSKFLTQIQYCEDKNIPLMVVVGGEEKEKGGVKVRDVSQRTEVFTCNCVCFKQGIFDCVLCMC